MIGLPGGANDFFASSDAEVFLVLKAFFDGSQRQNLFVLAGYVGHVRYWRRFGLEWNNVCFKYGIKSGLHMKHFAFSRGEFEKFNGRETLRRSFLADLLNVLYRKPYRFLGIGSAIDLAAYQDWREKFSFTDWRSEPYFSAFRDSVATTIEQPLFKHLPRSEKFAFVFDRQDESEGEALRVFNTLKEFPEIPASQRQRLESIVFGSRSEVPALQAADLIAYETGKSLEAMMEGKDPDARWPMRKIKEGPCGIRMFTRRSFERWQADQDLHSAS